MANISEEKWIEMLEKKSDGSYIAKYPKVKSKSGVTFDEHLADDATQAHMAKNIGLEDISGNFAATELEGAMSELFTNVSDGKQMVGGAITGVDDSVVIPTDPTFNDLASAIGGISTGKKWASGDGTTTSLMATVSGLEFIPNIILIYSPSWTACGFFIRSKDPTGYHLSRISGVSIKYYGANINSNGFSLRADFKEGQDNIYKWFAFD